MSEVVSDILVGLSASAAAISVASVVLKKTVEKWIETQFAKNLEQFAQENRKELAMIQGKLNDFEYRTRLATDRRNDAFATLAERIYRAKNCMSDSISRIERMRESDSSTVSAELSQVLDNLTEVIESYATQLYVFRLYVEESLFLRLHAYKRLINNFRIMVTLLREDNALLPKYVPRLKNLLSNAQETNRTLIACLQSSLGIKGAFHKMDIDAGGNDESRE